jgi:drug/metabolite transporter (DMT)-like permease
VATLPLAALGFALFWAWNEVGSGAGAGIESAASLTQGRTAFEMPFGPTPGLFLGLMFSIGLFASWLGTLCWNEASQRLPPSLVGQLIVFETLAALSYAWVLRGRWPDAFTLAGATLLVGGVVWAMRAAAQRPPTPGRLNLSPGTLPP